MPQPRDSLLSETGAFLGRAAGWLLAIHFAAVAVVTALSPSTYDREARLLAARQVHFSAWQALPGFMLACALLSFVLIRIVVGTAQAYGLPQYALELTVRLLVLELIPIFAALFVALRSGATISTEVALMHIGGEFERIARSGRDPLAVELVPRALGSLVAVMLLTYLSSVVALVLAYGALYGVSPWALATFVRITGQVFEPMVAVGFILKTVLLGAAVGAIPIGAALGIRRDPAEAPGAMRRGMVRLGIALAVIEIVFLAVMYA